MSDPVLSVKDLHIHFGAAHAIKGVSFDLSRGETLALVGESGSGKSVTALSTVALLPKSATVNGSITYMGRELVGATPACLREVRGNDISFIFQEPMTSLNPLHTIEKQIGESLRIHQGVVGDHARPKIVDLLNKVGIRNPETRLNDFPHQLSGGQRQRVMIAMALANEPDVLIADEPTTALDVTIEKQILELLGDLQKSEGLALLFITHDLGVVRSIADRVCVMQNGEIVESGETQTLFAKPKHPYTQKLLGAEPTGVAEPVDNTAEPVLAVQNLQVLFPIQRGLMRRTVGHVRAVEHASFTLVPGETLGIVGESGSGKTTAALAVMRLIRSTGSILFNGEELQGLSNKALRSYRADMQIVFQDPYGSLSPRLSVEQIITEGLDVHQADRAGDRDALVDQILTEVGLSPDMKYRYPHEFSGGQRQRIAIARAMILRPKLVILDEPTSALDMTVQVQIVDLLRDLQKRYGLAYIFISHDLRVVRAMSHKIMVMKQGEVVEAGSAASVFDTPENPYTQTLLSAALN
ncbi:MAG: ABC transporter ATP-binding protein [Pseudomonadota bacterium]